MPAAIAPYVPYLATGAIAFAYYRRIRRSFGRQPWQPTRTVLRVLLLLLVAGALVFAAVFVPKVAPAMLAGALIGAVLGAFALRHTHAQWVDGQGWYTPNPWIGGVLMVLLLGRMAWRYTHGAFSAGAGQASQQANPLTLGIAGTLIVYALVNGVGLILRMRRLRQAVQGGGA